MVGCGRGTVSPFRATSSPLRVRAQYDYAGPPGPPLVGTVTELKDMEASRPILAVYVGKVTCLRSLG